MDIYTEYTKDQIEKATMLTAYAIFLNSKGVMNLTEDEIKFIEVAKLYISNRYKYLPVLLLVGNAFLEKAYSF